MLRISEIPTVFSERKNRANSYFKKNLKPNSAAFFFITLHDLTTRVSCSSVNPPPAIVYPPFFSSLSQDRTESSDSRYFVGVKKNGPVAVYIGGPL